MTSLREYAEAQIAKHKLGHGGPLGTEFVCVYEDVGEGAIRICDGYAEDICHTPEQVDASLQQWVDWIEEN